MSLAKAFYFLFFGAAVCLIPFLSLYYQGLGLSGREIGFLVGIVPLTGMVGSSIWSMASDATGRHRALFLASIVGTWLSVLAMSRMGTFAGLIPFVLLFAFCSSPIIPLVDNSVLDIARTTGQGDYGRTRVWGAYGWAIGGAITGILIERSGIQWAFYGYLALMALLLLVAVPLPMNVSAVGGRFWGSLRTLLADRAWLLFLAVALVVGMSLSIFLNFLFPYLETLGFSRTIMGFSLTVATISEIPIFLGSKKLLARWGSPLLLAAALLFSAVRAFAYIALTAPWQLLLISLLHGLSFTLMWIAGVAYADRLAPPGLGATAQGVFSGLVMGGGVALGAFAGGFIYDRFSPVAVFYFAGVSAVAALVVFLSANWSLFVAQLQPARR